DLTPPQGLRVVLTVLRHECLRLIPGYAQLVGPALSQPGQEKLLTVLDVAWQIKQDPQGYLDKLLDAPEFRERVQRLPDALLEVMSQALQETSSGLEPVVQGVTQAAQGLAGNVSGASAALGNAISDQVGSWRASVGASFEQFRSISDEILDGVLENL